jgi:predicted  nucleic acid-binding Zn-ribbon protein
MLRHDNEPVPEIPALVPERDELATYQRKQIKPKAKERASEPDADLGAESYEKGSNLWAYVAGAVALAAVGWAGYLQSQLLGAEQRVAALEQRLSSTDESVSQSNVTLQVRIKELDAALSELRDSTLKNYKTTLDQRGAQLDNLDKVVKSTQGSATKLEQQVAEQSKALDSARVQLDKVSPLVELSNLNKKKADEHQLALDSLSSKIKAVSDGQAKLDGRLSNNEEWVESINVFRKQMNREIVNIKQQVAGSKPGAAPAEPIQ